MQGPSQAYPHNAPAAQQRPPSVALVWLLLAASLAAEAAAVFALSRADVVTTLIAFLGLHLGAAGLAAEGLRVSAKRGGFGGSTTLSTAGAFLSIAFPVIGTLTVCYLAMVRPVGRRSYAGQESLESKRAQAAQDAIERKRAAQQVGGEVRSIVDALKDRDKDVRIAAVESLRGEVSQKAVQFLAQSQVNTMFDVRVRAIENLNLLRDTFRKRLADSRNRVQETQGGLDALLDHAQLCFENAELGIEDVETAKSLFLEAHAHASEVSARWPGSKEVRTISARALRALRRYSDAELEYAEILKLDRSDNEAMFGLAEIQFQRRDFDSLRTTCRLIVRMKSGDIDAELAPVFRMWLKRAGAVA
ncbi:MAG: hypothetical protein GY811_14010 [Myxococcales bacterium]|nr:hypothetical protein [Myxococcales bacterium]